MARAAQTPTHDAEPLVGDPPIRWVIADGDAHQHWVGGQEQLQRHVIGVLCAALDAISVVRNHITKPFEIRRHRTGCLDAGDVIAMQAA